MSANDRDAPFHGRRVCYATDPFARRCSRVVQRPGRAVCVRYGPIVATAGRHSVASRRISRRLPLADHVVMFVLKISPLHHRDSSRFRDGAPFGTASDSLSIGASLLSPWGCCTRTWMRRAFVKMRPAFSTTLGPFARSCGPHVHSRRVITVARRRLPTVMTQVLAPPGFVHAAGTGRFAAPMKIHDAATSPDHRVRF